MKKIAILTIGMLLFVSTSFAGTCINYPVQVNINSDGSKTVYGNIQNTACSGYGNDYLYIFSNGSNVTVGALDSDGDYAYGTSYDATMLQTVQSVSDWSYLNVRIDSDGKITFLGIGHYARMQCDQCP